MQTIDISRYRFTMRLVGWIVVGLALVGSPLARAQEDDEESIDGTSYGSEYNPSPKVSDAFKLPRERDRPRNYLLPPLVSWILPGFDQWVEGQYGYAGAYTGTAIGGIVFAEMNAKAYRQQAEDNAERARQGKSEENPIDTEDVKVRKYTLGTLIYQGAGSLSTYHSFRSAVPTRKRLGEFKFLTKEETPADLMLSPFRFEYMLRPSTYIPVGIAAALHLITINSDLENIKKDSLTSADIFFTSAFSYNAGVHEEALFRGYVMPVMMHWMGSPFWSNTATAGLFALAHLNTVSIPLPQLLLGWYLGNLTQRRQWTISEAIFIHAWWDVFAFLTEFQITRLKDGEAAAMPVYWLPPLSLNF